MGANVGHGETSIVRPLAVGERQEIVRPRARERAVRSSERLCAPADCERQPAGSAQKEKVVSRLRAEPLTEGAIGAPRKAPGRTWPDTAENSPQPSGPLSAQEERRSYAAKIGCGSESAQRPTSTI